MQPYTPNKPDFILYYECYHHHTIVCDVYKKKKYLKGSIKYTETQYSWSETGQFDLNENTDISGG